eukprot:768280-Hanusia_phi.AAC.3
MEAGVEEVEDSWGMIRGWVVIGEVAGVGGGVDHGVGDALIRGRGVQAAGVGVKMGGKGKPGVGRYFIAHVRALPQATAMAARKGGSERSEVEEYAETKNTHLPRQQECSPS